MYSFRLKIPIVSMRKIFTDDAGLAGPSSLSVLARRDTTGCLGVSPPHSSTPTLLPPSRFFARFFWISSSLSDSSSSISSICNTHQLINIHILEVTSSH